MQIKWLLILNLTLFFFIPNSNRQVLNQNKYLPFNVFNYWRTQFKYLRIENKILILQVKKAEINCKVLEAKLIELKEVAVSEKTFIFP